MGRTLASDLSATSLAGLCTTLASCRARRDYETFEAVMRAAWTLARRASQGNAGTASPSVCEKLRKHWALYEARTELRFSRAAASSPRLSPYVAATGRHAQDERSLLARGDVRHLVVVGIGAVPVTLSRLAGSFPSASTVGVDADARMVRAARAMLRAWSIPRSRVRLVESDGRTFNYNGADTVVVGNLVRGKLAVLRRIQSTAAPHVRVLVRVPSGWGRLFFEELTPPARWQVVSSTRRNRTLLNQSLLLQRARAQARADQAIGTSPLSRR